MLIGGFQRNSLVDFPGIVASVIFLAGCNFHCPYCHNPSLVKVTEQSEHFSLDEILSYLFKAKKIIDGVCITGGEPTLWGDELFLLVHELKKIALKVKLDTNGSHPEILKKLIVEKRIDYVALDLKTSFERYFELSSEEGIGLKVKESFELLQNQNDIAYEFRTTLDPRFVGPLELEKIAALMKGSDKWYWQQFKTVQCLDESSKDVHAYTLEQLKELQQLLDCGILR